MDRTKKVLDAIIAEETAEELNQTAFWLEYGRACAAEKPTAEKPVAAKPAAKPAAISAVSDTAGQRRNVRHHPYVLGGG